MSTLGDSVKTRIGNQRLVQLTNDDATATTVDDDVLEAAADDTTGEFERLTGLTFDATNRSHLAIAIGGVIWKLEDYKARDGGILSGHAKSFLGACAGLRKTLYISPATSSVLLPSSEKSNARPDMDRKKTVWRYGRRSVSIPEISGEDD